MILGDRIKKSEKNTNPALSLEEIQHAQKYRKKALRSPGMCVHLQLDIALIIVVDLDLAEIARTSAAVVNSPPPIPSVCPLFRPLFNACMFTGLAAQLLINT